MTLWMATTTLMVGRSPSTYCVSASTTITNMATTILVWELTAASIAWIKVQCANITSMTRAVTNETLLINLKASII